MLSLKAYFKRYFLIVIIGLIAIATFNLMVDPVNIFRIISIPNFNQEKPYIDIQGMSRVKAIEISEGNYDTVLLGNSRVFWGLDPSSPAFGNKKAYNAGLMSASMYQIKQVFDYARQNLDLKTVVIGLNLNLFDANRPWILPDQDFKASPFANSNLIMANLGSLLAKDTLLYSWNTITYNLKNEQFNKYTEKGFLNPDFSTLNRTKNFRKLANKMRNNQYQLRLSYEQKTLEFLEEIIDICEENKIELKLFIEPTHSVMENWLDKSRNKAVFERWKQDIIKISFNRSDLVELWDFTGANFINSETIPPNDQTQMQWYLDPIHYTHFTGELIITRLFDQSLNSSDFAQNFGILIN